jgi:hypothetical protein
MSDLPKSDQPIEPSNELSPEERAGRVKLFKEQTSPLLREFLYNIGDEKKQEEILEKTKASTR